MTVAATVGGTSLRVHEVLQRWAGAYRERFGTRMPARQIQVLDRILSCRTAARGGSLLYCPACHTYHFHYRSCNDRHCVQCGQPDADQWLFEHQRFLLPTPYFLVTFTVPEALRKWMRSHPRQAYTALFAASAQAMQDLASNPKRLGATLGMLAVLHTWSRTLLYHPHVHYLVPGGGLRADGRAWVPARHRFLFPVKALALRYRTLFGQALEAAAPEALQALPAKVWKQGWVVHCAPAGSGANALAYLARYVFKTATGDRRLELLPDGRLAWPYRDSKTGQSRQVTLQPLEFLRRFLEHVLPQGFHRVRLFGWFHPAARLAFNRVRALLHERPVLTPAQRRTWLQEEETLSPGEPLEALPKPSGCPRCHGPLRCLGSWSAGQIPLRPPERAPP